jgi:hypothetical protein
MSGGTQDFYDQVVKASVVNQSAVFSLIIGIAVMVIERAIYKKNPKEWRNYFQYKESKLNYPVDIKQLDFCLKTSLNQGKMLEEIEFEDLHYDETEYKSEKAKLKKKKGGITESINKKKKDNSYKENPLLVRYYFLIFLTFAVTGVSWAYFPMTYTISRISNQIFAADITLNPPSIKARSSDDPYYFQDYILFKLFYILCVLYLVVSAFQIRLGEPINKGRRELLSKFNIVYMSINKVIRVIPFFFTISITIDFMFTASSLDIWEWFKFESIYEELYKNIMENKSKSANIPGLKQGSLNKVVLGLVLAFAQIFLLICPFIFFGKFSSNKNTVEFASLSVALKTGSSRSVLYSTSSAKSNNTLDEVTFNSYFMGKGESKNKTTIPDSITSISRLAVQIISFYKISSNPFNINLDELDREINYLSSWAPGTSDKVYTSFILKYKQKESSKEDSSSLKNLERTFAWDVELGSDQVNSILKMYSLLRNIGSGNPQRSLADLENIKVQVETDLVGLSYQSC